MLGWKISKKHLNEVGSDFGLPSKSLFLTMTDRKYYSNRVIPVVRIVHACNTILTLKELVCTWDQVTGD